MLYFQEPLINKLQGTEPTQKKAEKLALLYLERCKITREIVSENTSGIFRIKDAKAIEKEISKGQTSLPKNINTKDPSSIEVYKPSIFKGIMSYTGILGYFNPFTAEAQYNSQLPDSFTPFTLAHESAHQLGFAREQEANFIGYLIGKNSENNDLRYSTELFVLKSLLSAINEKNPEFVQSILENYSTAMKRDRTAEKNFIEKHRGLLDVFFGFTNDLFLKANQQEGSITYSYFIDLLLRYEDSPEEIE